MAYNDLKRFTTGMDLDTDSRLITGYRSAYNIILGTSQDGGLGAIKNDKGNILVNFVLPNGTNECVGQCEDIENNAIIYFVYNNNGNDSILRYFITTNTIQKILQWGNNNLWKIRLSFSPDHLITSCYVIQGLLYWQQDNVPPRKINIDKAIAFTNNQFGFDDNGYDFTTGNVYFYSNTNTVPSSISVGDTVYISQNTGYTNQTYEGYSTVLAINSPIANSILIDTPFGIATAPEPGFVILVNKDTYTYIDEQTIDRIKWPPKLSPICSYQNDGNYKFNNLRGSTFQFSYSNIYDDNEVSTFSPITKLPIPYNEETLGGDYINNVIYNNVIYISVNTGNHNIKAINIYGRSNATDSTPITVSANNSNWYLIDRIEKYDASGNKILEDNIIYDYLFYNNKIKDIVDQSNAARLFDYVPQLCGSSELVEKNRILDGDITEGYDNIDIDIKLTSRKETVSYPTSSVSISSNITIRPEFAPTLSGLYIRNSINYIPFINGSYYETQILSTAPSPGDIFSFSMQYTIVGDPNPGTIYTYSKQVIADYADTVNYPHGFRDKIANILSQDLPVCLVDSNINTIYIMKKKLTGGGDTYILDFPVISLTHFTNQTPYKSWKQGSVREFGIVYEDRANRSGATNTSDKSEVYIPTYSEDSMAGNTSQNGYRSVIDWEISNKPPIWATHYQWVCSMNTTEKEYIQYNVKNISYNPNGKVVIKFNTSLVDYNSIVYKSILGTWIWQKGDRLKFILYSSGVNGQWTFMDSLNTWNPNYMYTTDYEIVGVDAASGDFILENFDITFFTTTIGVPITDIVVEVYRPKKEIGEQIFYEIGENFEIGDAGLSTRYHKGQTQDQTSLLPAKGTFASGDTYYKLRRTSQNSVDFQYFPCESEHLSDFYISDSYDIGRVNVEDRNMKQRRLKANMRFSQKLIQDTQINGISTFLFLDLEQMPDKYGAIERLVEVADVIKIIQNNKCSSIYAGRQSTAEADTSTNIYITSKVLGTIVIPPENYGTVHPESVCKWNRQLYFFDLLNGVYVRDSANGFFEISSYGAVDYFRKWQKEILASQSVNGRTKVLSAYDKITEQLIVTLSYSSGTQIQLGQIQSHIMSRKETIAFLENVDEVATVYSNQWKTFYNFTPEYYGYNGSAFVSFLNGELWLHHNNPIRCNYYGVKYPEKVTFICNIEPETIKRFMAMAYNSNKRWTIERVYIPPSENYPQGMLSEIKDSKFVSKEGFYYSEFNKDMLTPGFTSTLEALINGRDLRGQTVEITMSNLHDDDVLLFSSYVNLLPSPKSGVK